MGSGYTCCICCCLVLPGAVCRRLLVPAVFMPRGTGTVFAWWCMLMSGSVTYWRHVPGLSGAYLHDPSPRPFCLVRLHEHLVR